MQTTHKATGNKEKESSGKGDSLTANCMADHGLGISFEPECDHKYCAPRYFLHNVLCNGCGVKFVEQIT